MISDSDFFIGEVTSAHGLFWDGIEHLGLGYVHQWADYCTSGKGHMDVYWHVLNIRLGRKACKLFTSLKYMTVFDHRKRMDLEP